MHMCIVYVLSALSNQYFAFIDFKFKLLLSAERIKLLRNDV